MMRQFTRAKRRAVPIVTSVAGKSGSGKTYSGILYAAGLCRVGGRVFLADTENGRGEMYADSPGILKALPDGYEYIRMDPPFTPKSHIEVIDAAEKAGQLGDVLLFDSGSHEWEGAGGCCDIAEKFKLGNRANWAKAKIEHKKFLNRLLFSNLHIVVCLRAREKVKITASGEVVERGLQPICEKAFVYEMMLSVILDEVTHFPRVLKAPEALRGVFGQNQLITKEHGELVRKWNDTGDTMSAAERLYARARMAAGGGKETYRQFLEGLTEKARHAVVSGPHGSTFEQIARDVDEELLRAETDPGPQPEVVAAEEGASPIDALRKRIDAMSEEIGLNDWREVMDNFGKESVADITNELQAEDMLAAMKERKKC